MKILSICIALNLMVMVSHGDAAVTQAPIPIDLEEKTGSDSPDEEPDPDDAIAGRSKDDDLPVLPPIILLDFADTNSTSDEKSKRTVDNGLGYGYLRNNLLNGKYNYYFPGGKTGTTVSIEESISPFEPKTIIEQFKPMTDRPDYSSPTTTYQPNVQETRGPQVNQNYQVFGQRTRLQKYSPPDNYNPQGFTPKPITYTTLRPDYQTPTPKPQEIYSGLSDYTTPRPIYENYQSTPATPSYTERNFPVHNHQRPYETPTTGRPLPVDPAAFNLPRYTVENGIRYENKIIWKYQDGRIADGPPSSFVNSYSEYSTPRSPQSFQRAPQDPRYETHRPQDSRYPQDVQYQSLSGYQPSQELPPTNIHNQRPAQFPVDQEPRYPQGTQNYNPGSQPQQYDLSYQHKYGFRQREQSSRYEPTRPMYAVDSPNPEYSTTPPSSNLLTPSGQLTPNLLSKYTPQAQKYLTKVFSGQSGKMREHPPNYENLLNYNPSISQYIRDPSSILNAQPTFIQAGNSLIPVIILRVDGAPPVQPQAAPSINLKALLQQYLSQYAESKAALSQTSNYDYKGQLGGNNPVNDLTRLANALRSFTQREAFPQKLADHPLNYEATRYHDKSSYDTVNQQVAKPKYGTRVPGKQKVKSVQILEDS